MIVFCTLSRVSQLVTFIINVGDEFLVISLLVAVGFRKVETHERDVREHGDRQMR